MTDVSTTPARDGVEHTPALHRALGTLDLILLNIAAIVGLRWLSIAAQIGPASLTLWLLGLLTFLIPSALTVLELSSRLPGEGGFYLWSRAAFGELPAFIAGWSYWISNLVYFPSLLLFGAGVALYIHGGNWLALADSRLYNGAFSLIALWLAIVLNIVGLERAKWLQNVGGVATWIVGALVLCGAILSWHRFGTATPIAVRTLVPDVRSLATLGSFATIALAYQGLELGAVLGGELKHPRQSMARALLLSCIAIAVLYIAGTTALFMALPGQQINVISGIAQALAAVASRLGVPTLGLIAAALLAVSQVGGLGAWITGTARLPFLFGLDRYLPKALGAVHPRFGSPHVALLTQGVLATAVLLMALSGSAIREAYFVLIDMTLVLGFVPLLYMFAALPILRRRARTDESTVRLIPGGPLVCWLVAGTGFAVTLLALVLAMVPPSGSTHRGLFALKDIGGCVFLWTVGLVLYARRATRRSELMGVSRLAG